MMSPDTCKRCSRLLTAIPRGTAHARARFGEHDPPVHVIWDVASAFADVATCHSVKPQVGIRWTPQAVVEAVAGPGADAVRIVRREAVAETAALEAAEPLPVPAIVPA